eukprot:6244056-Pyramimonas_sp.AAC.1
MLGLEPPQCMDAWTLRLNGAYGKAFVPSFSIAQGLRGGAGFGACATCRSMQTSATAHANLPHRIWVDDLSQFVVHRVIPSGNK